MLNTDFLRDDSAENSIMQTITIAVSAILIAAGLVTAPGLINNARDNNATTDLANIAYGEEFMLSDQGVYSNAVTPAQADANGAYVGKQGSVKYTLSGKVTNQSALTCKDPGWKYLLKATSSSGKTYYRSSESPKTSTDLAKLSIPDCISGLSDYNTFGAQSDTPPVALAFTTPANLGSIDLANNFNYKLANNMATNSNTTYSVAAGSTLPTGVTLTSDTLAGRPTTLGVNKFTIQAKVAKRVATQDFTLVVSTTGKALAIPTSKATYTTIGSTYSATMPVISGYVISPLDGYLYYGDSSHHIVKMSADGKTSSIFAGSGQIGNADGLGKAASFNQPEGMAVDSAGNLYVADATAKEIRKISPDGYVSTLTTGVTFRDVAIAPDGSIYGTSQGVGDMRIYKIAQDGTKTVYAGSGASGKSNESTGKPLTATFNNPEGLDFDSAGNLYVAEVSNGLVRKITPSGNVTTFVDLSGTTGVSDVAVDSAGNVFTVGGNTVRKYNAAGSYVQQVAGNGTAGNNNTINSASLYQPRRIVLTPNGNILSAVGYYNTIRVIS
jgi:sugar lactone lactonase YvrE